MAREITMVRAVNEAMLQAMEADERVMVLGEDVGKNGGVFRATDDLQERFGEERVVDTPISESGIVGNSIGLAMNGFRPVAEIQFMGFIYSGLDQLASQAARMRFRSGGVWTAPMVVRGPFGGGVRTPELHGDSLEALFTHSPGLKVVVPGTPYDAKGLLLSAIADPDPVVFFEPMKLYRAFREDVPEEPYEVPIGEAKVVREGEDATVVAWGAPVALAKQVSVKMQEENDVSLEVIDLRTLTPFDGETVSASVRKTGRAVVVHEAVKTGGFGAEVVARIMEGAFLYLEAPVERVTGYDTPYPVTQVEDEWLPTAGRLTEAVKRSLIY